MDHSNCANLGKGQRDASRLLTEPNPRVNRAIKTNWTALLRLLLYQLHQTSEETNGSNVVNEHSTCLYEICDYGLFGQATLQRVLGV